MRITFRSTAVIVAILSLSNSFFTRAIAADAQDIGQQLSGDWMGCYARNPPRKTASIPLMRLSVNGGVITGTMRSDGGSELPVSGSVESGRVFFTRKGKTSSGEVLNDKFVGLSLRENEGSLTMNGKVEAGIFVARSGSNKEAWFVKIREGAETPKCPL